MAWQVKAGAVLPSCPRDAALSLLCACAARSGAFGEGWAMWCGESTQKGQQKATWSGAQTDECHTPTTSRTLSYQAPRLRTACSRFEVARGEYEAREDEAPITSHPPFARHFPSRELGSLPSAVYAHVSFEKYAPPVFIFAH